MVVYPLLHGGKLGNNSQSKISLDRVVVGLGSDNLIKVIMEALMIGGGLP